MSLFERISEEEKDAIRYYIQHYAGEDGGSLNKPVGNLEYILRFWNKNKENVGRFFNDKLIISRSIRYSKPEEIIEEEMSNLINRYSSPEYRDFFADWDAMLAKECGPRTWDWDDPNEIKRQCLISLLEYSTLASNTYDGDPITIHDNNLNKDIIIPKGCKIMKAIGKIVRAKNLNVETFEQMRVEHSRCLNQKYMHGTLCLSIHPLDFMTMSDNDCDWSSCMNWVDGGEYRQGTVEMMNSSYIVMAYLKSDSHPYSIDGLNWSNKKWRQLFIVSPKIIMGIKSYPYHSEECEEIALCWLRELAQEAGFGSYMDEIQSVSNEYHTNLTDGRVVDFSFNMHHMYNDITTGHRAFVSKGTLNSSEYFMLSGETECMLCGDNMTPYRDDMDTADLVCHECQPAYRCSSCGERLSEHDDIFWLDGEPYCEYCYDQNAIQCPCCEEIHHSDRFNRVFLTLDDQYIFEDEDYCPQIELCDDCANWSFQLGSSRYAVLKNSDRVWNCERRAVNPKNFKKLSYLDYFFEDDEEMADKFIKDHHLDEDVAI